MPNHPYRNRRYYTLAEGDVGQNTLRAFGKLWSVEDFIGRVLPGDVGKRVYLVGGSGSDAGGILQVENDEQRNRRITSNG